MSIFASLGGARISVATLSIPAVGLWVADVTMTDAPALTSPVTLQIGTLSLVGYLFRSAAFTGSFRARVAGGLGGWKQRAAAKGYSLTGGVMLSVVLGDLAREVGERIVLPTDRSLGAFYNRERAPAETVLNRECASWYTNATGETVIGARPGGAIGSPFDVLAFNPSSGIVTVGVTESYGDWLPGRTFRASTISERTIRGTTIRIMRDKSRIEVMT